MYLHTPKTGGVKVGQILQLQNRQKLICTIKLAGTWLSITRPTAKDTATTGVLLIGRSGNRITPSRQEEWATQILPHIDQNSVLQARCHKLATKKMFLSMSIHQRSDKQDRPVQYYWRPGIHNTCIDQCLHLDRRIKRWRVMKSVTTLWSANFTETTID